MSSTPNKQNPPFQCNVPVIMMQWFTFTCNRVLYSVVLVLILKQKIQYFLHFCSELNASRSDSSSALTTQSDNDLLILLSERQRIMKPVSPTVCQMFCWLDVRLRYQTKRFNQQLNATREPNVSENLPQNTHPNLVQVNLPPAFCVSARFPHNDDHACVTTEVHPLTRPAYLMMAFMTSVVQEAEQTKGSRAWSAAAVTISTSQPGGVCVQPDRRRNVLQRWTFAETYSRLGTVRGSS